MPVRDMRGKKENEKKGGKKSTALSICTMHFKCHKQTIRLNLCIFTLSETTWMSSLIPKCSLGRPGEKLSAHTTMPTSPNHKNKLFSF